jgi:hypothetical protein
VTGPCFAYGQAIGLAAAIAAAETMSPRALDGADLRAQLKRDGVEL